MNNHTADDSEVWSDFKKSSQIFINRNVVINSESNFLDAEVDLHGRCV